MVTPFSRGFHWKPQCCAFFAIRLGWKISFFFFFFFFFFLYALEFWHNINSTKNYILVLVITVYIIIYRERENPLVYVLKRKWPNFFPSCFFERHKPMWYYSNKILLSKSIKRIRVLLLWVVWGACTGLFYFFFKQRCLSTRIRMAW